MSNLVPPHGSKKLKTLALHGSELKSELKKAYQALKSLKSLLVGHKSGEATLSFSDLKKILQNHICFLNFDPKQKQTFVPIYKS